MTAVLSGDFTWCGLGSGWLGPLAPGTSPGPSPVLIESPADLSADFHRQLWPGAGSFEVVSCVRAVLLCSTQTLGSPAKGPPAPAAARGNKKSNHSLLPWQSRGSAVHLQLQELCPGKSCALDVLQPKQAGSAASRAGAGAQQCGCSLSTSAPSSELGG